VSIIHYRDTRGLDLSLPTFTDVVIKGIAPGGGLYVPEILPRLDLDAILQLAALPYAGRAATIFRAFGVDLGHERLDELMPVAFGANFDDPRVAPVRCVAEGVYVLELWHGPTSAFKDMALQCLPVLFSEAVTERLEQGRDTPKGYLVLVATSGDTGKAALEGFADREHTRVAVFYPADGVSDIQRRQMVTQRGGNVAVFGVRGNFDDCQTAVKAAFNDPDFNAELGARFGLALSSANSINWGRLLPQIVYYASAYADMVAAGDLPPGQPLDVCVPTGNFGNILAGFYARRIGVPIGRLLCASNENNVLADFLCTSTYDVAERTFVTTPSPSMDILVSSNLERVLYELCGDPERVRRWMADLTTTGRFHVDSGCFGHLRDHFLGDYVSNDESLATIWRVFERTRYLMDPHTAVAWRVAERHRSSAPVLVVSTAHWAKFGGDVFRALSGLPYRAALPEPVAALSELALLDEVLRLAPEESIPRGLSGLAGLPERFTGVVDGGRDGVEGAVRAWLGSGRA